MWQKLQIFKSHTRIQSKYSNWILLILLDSLIPKTKILTVSNKSGANWLPLQQLWVIALSQVPFAPRTVSGRGLPGKGEVSESGAQSIILTPVAHRTPEEEESDWWQEIWAQQVIHGRAPCVIYYRDSALFTPFNERSSTLLLLTWAQNLIGSGMFSLHKCSHCEFW